MSIQTTIGVLALCLLLLTGCKQLTGEAASSTLAPATAPVARIASAPGASATVARQPTHALLAPTRTPLRPVLGPPPPEPSATAAPTATSPEPSATAAPTASPEPIVIAEPAHDSAALTIESAPPTPEPSPVSDQVHTSEPQRVVIEAIGLDGVAVSVGLDENMVPIVPQHEIGWYNLSAMPGQGENVVFWGHVLRFQSAPDIPAPFARLREAEVGNQVRLYSADGQEHIYQITQQLWVTPEQVEYILPQGREMVTMVSCIGEAVIAGSSVVDMSHRLITIAEPVQ